MGGALVILIGFLILNRPPAATSSDTAPQVTVYKSTTCGCCAQYIAYLKREGFEVETINSENMADIKEQYDIPGQIQSCHTTVYGDLAMEGHIPVAALRSFMESPDDADGIALPGMPSGSPGMPGVKQGPFTIYRFNENGIETHSTL
ncbi:hypothetical protein A3B32_00725 [Candidatus Uhrbacteria bacterium RIFCSPLOWO2_01_FULL_53_9]|uniref:CopG family transcriptional regulator n=3 Tax=Candidatus Uhriibacteriota TaxID=1752732 RepID=A0A1F7UXH2_9BACT|nr:MAG: hypothetical protein A3C17_00190 [Candidatus Uhrbacteria bacterium RIFCSPHIGHO2_02_FULL_53_13]OGL82969.1 MAG: hypothetical protein A3B32_00725 [Candidatus Uhrbacteria bacterium RIFCSPLOWO2_01_FULL_53_9]OGL89675.1 MAG: hypothetical protein A3I45_01805 [Candidatus Uhrbacteria bacterium RIFCSPLOWO2_02_FULL_53_10]